MPDSFISAPEYASFWEIQRHFLERTLNMEAAREVLVVVGAVVGLLLAIFLFLHFRPKKPYIPQDWITDPLQVRNTLGVALSQRAKVELQFAAEGLTRRPALRCSLQDIGSDDLLVEASGLSSFSSRWEGRAVDCFFMLRKQESFSFYAFATTIKRVNVTESSCRIWLSFPEKIESRQKRSYLRITPPDEYMLGAAFWRGADMPEGSDRNDLALWNKPSRLWIPGMREDFSIRDISSGACGCICRVTLWPRKWISSMSATNSSSCSTSGSRTKPTGSGSGCFAACRAPSSTLKPKAWISAPNSWPRPNPRKTAAAALSGSSWPLPAKWSRWATGSCGGIWNFSASRNRPSGSANGKPRPTPESAKIPRWSAPRCHGSSGSGKRIDADASAPLPSGARVFTV